MSFDGRLVDAFTEGMRAPSEGEQWYFAGVNGLSPPNLIYYSPTQYAAIVAGLVRGYAEAVSPDGTVVAASGGTHDVSVTLESSKVYELRARYIVESGGGSFFYEKRNVFLSVSSAGAVTVLDNIVESTSGSASIVASTVTSTNLFTARLTNNTGSARGGSISVSVHAVTDVPAAP